MPPNTRKRPTGVCLHCGKPIAQNIKGIWGARKRGDPHPWYCDDAPAKSVNGSSFRFKRHEVA